MIKGGYKIIDFKGTELSTTAVEISGIYNQIVDDYNKPIMVSGVIISGKLQDDAYASVKVADSSVTLTVYDGFITVNNDEVTFTQVDSNAKLTEDVSAIKGAAIMKTSNVTLTSDLNDAQYGWAYYGTGALNRPANATYFVLTLFHENTKCQLAINRSTASLSTRTFTNEAWTEWKTATNA